MYLYFIFGCAGCASLRGALADCCSGGFSFFSCGAQASHCPGFSGCRAEDRGHMGSQTLEHGLGS